MLRMNDPSTALRASSAATCPFFLVLLLCISFCSTSSASGQPVPTFDVATIKPVDSKNPLPPSVTISPDRFQATSMTLRDLIKIAWNLNYGADEQIAGGPDWVALARFDLDAKEDAAVTMRIESLPTQQQGDEVRNMLRELLTARFHLKLHHETRNLPVYELVIAKGGPRLLPAAALPPLGKKDDTAEKSRRWIRFAGVGQLESYGADISTLVTALSMQPEIGGRLILDETGLTGSYDFTLKWTPDIDRGTAIAADSGPSLFTALQEELGLRLESAKAPVDRIVIDQVTPPVEN
ncbi:MAG TPA: TIGR03435 family protein [Acidobacteriaceae bacterium]|nr:TIGR03435 family protein [Acidobacteriaceae bacterium]